MTNLTFFRPSDALTNQFLGFERLFDQLERISQSGATANFPPLNIFREKSGEYVIEMALAGYRRDDVMVEHDRKNGILTIKSAPTQSEDYVTEPEGRTTIRRGIAKRAFTRAFTVADNLRVTDASLTDGMLTIRLVEEVREEDKPLLITLK